MSASFRVDEEAGSAGAGSGAFDDVELASMQSNDFDEAAARPRDKEAAAALEPGWLRRAVFRAVGRALRTTVLKVLDTTARILDTPLRSLAPRLPLALRRRKQADLLPMHAVPAPTPAAAAEAPRPRFAMVPLAPKTPPPKQQQQQQQQQRVRLADRANLCCAPTPPSKGNEETMEL